MYTKAQTFGETKTSFIESWGKLGVNWGVCKTMGEIHGLLLIACKPLSADEITQELCISRANVTINMRELLEWGLAYKINKEGDRKEYYIAEKSLFKIFRQVLANRKRKELDPLIELLEQCGNVQSKCSESRDFQTFLEDLKFFTQKADSAIDLLTNSDPKWFKSFLSVIRPGC